MKVDQLVIHQVHHHTVHLGLDEEAEEVHHGVASSSHSPAHPSLENNPKQVRHFFKLNFSLKVLDTVSTPVMSQPSWT